MLGPVARTAIRVVAMQIDRGPYQIYKAWRALEI